MCCRKKMWNICQLFSNYRSKKSDHTMEVFRIKQWYLRPLFVSNIGALIFEEDVKSEYFQNHFSNFPPPSMRNVLCWIWLIHFDAFVGIKNNKLWQTVFLHNFASIYQNIKSNWGVSEIDNAMIDLKNHRVTAILLQVPWSLCSFSWCT